MRLSMSPCINVHVMNECVYNLYIREYDTNIPKENLPPPLPVTYQNIYPVVFPNTISYTSTSNFIIIFFDIFHV